MSWWDTVYEMMKVGDVLFTPGRGIDGGNKKKPFDIFSMDRFKIVVGSGNAKIPLVKECFDVVENALVGKKSLWLRVASLKDNEPLPDSADKLIRDATKSQLARGNYVCAILEHCGLVKYSMMVNKKVIKLV